MQTFSDPFHLIEHGGSGIAVGVLSLTAYVILIILLFFIIHHIFHSTANEEQKRTGRVVRKYLIPEYREWQGKALVTIQEKKMFEIVVGDENFNFEPALWKYDKLNEGDEIDVIIQFDHHRRGIHVCDVGPF